ncbi:HK97-gp10 family putative phage morphogenesis protein [Bacillus safensis]|uniref:HK97-gp10 family putative phage morphogenesis protein n=1 Tax=Bacillus safensis TaxID=561879 RepID=UPI003CF9A237
MALEANGIEETYKAIEKMARQNVKAEKAAVHAGAKLMADGLEKNTPFDNDSGNKKHLKSDVFYSKPREDGEIYSTVGYGKETAYRLHFTNFGTIKQRPQSFIERTINEYEQSVLSKMQSVYRGLLGL